jgi:CRISPR-associated endonuclease/helicase Cas3
LTPYFAHSGSKESKSDWQSLKGHSLEVARLAMERAKPFGLERAARLAGLLHDLGKYTTKFQRRLFGETIRVDHSTAGAAVALQLVGSNVNEQLMGQMIAYTILGHHAGLPNRIDGAGSYDERIDAFLTDPTRMPDEIWRNEIQVDATRLFPMGFLPASDQQERQFQLAFMARMLFSCLVDADYRDTEDFYVKLEGLQKDRTWPLLRDSLPTLIAKFEAHMSRFETDGKPINKLRAEILTYVRAKAAEAPGLFTLTVPTGGGKTLASLGFALDHAKAHGHRRIIYAIPFTSIIDQTASIFRKLMGEDHVLEHHSAIDDDKTDTGEGDWRSRDKLKLAMEDWAAPVVVTTNVQFFESLFAAKTSRARKLHNIAGSVIILDEAQTIPRPLLIPCMRVLHELARNYGCSIVLCTATQPAVDETRLKGGLPLEGRELAPDPERLSQKLRRADVVQAGAMSNCDLVAALREAPQALVIVNSRKHALELYKDAKAAGLDGVLHLTTRQCAAHRRAIIEDVRRRLQGDTPCRVIATSLIEAGVDVDFPKVWRAEAGLDQVIQAAGRCNRENKRPRAESIVTIFSAPQYRTPREIESLTGDMARVAKTNPDIMSLAAIEQYFGEVYWRMGTGLDGKNILDMFGMSKRGTAFEFREAAREFRMIESGMQPVIVPFDQYAVDLVDRLEEPGISSGLLARQLQSYVVQVPPPARALLIGSGHVVFVRPDLRGDQFAVLKTASLYRSDSDEAVGLLWEDAAYLAKENSII